MASRLASLISSPWKRSPESGDAGLGPPQRRVDLMGRHKALLDEKAVQAAQAMSRPSSWRLAGFMGNLRENGSEQERSAAPGVPRP